MNAIFADQPKLITRFSKPTNFDQANYLTLCQAQEDLYIQTNRDPENPRWEYLGKLNSSEMLKIS